MTNVNKMLDKWQKVCAIPSDNAAAKRLGINRQAVHGWRTGQSYPTMEHVLQIAAEMHDPAENWLVMVQADRASSKEAKAAWAKLAARAGIAACLCLGLLTPPQSHASDHPQLSTITGQAMHMRESKPVGTEPGKPVRRARSGVCGTSARRDSGNCAGPAC